MDENSDALVIGAGPAGLMAAEVLAAAGARVLLAEAKPSPARKFLMAGKSGLNLTRAQDAAGFGAAFGQSADALAPMLADFGPRAVQDWARGLGQDLFTGSTGRVFPRAMKASPLLRAWLARLDAGGVDLRRGWHWTGWDGDGRAVFETPEGKQVIDARVCILALGGASWARLGSDGGWAGILSDAGVPLVPFAPANAGVQVTWSDHMARHFGTPLKGVAFRAGAAISRGEVVLTPAGIEGGGIYTLSPELRAGAALEIDLKPGLSRDEVTRRLAAPRGKTKLRDHLRKRLRLSPAAIALMQEFARPLQDGPGLVRAVKDLPVPIAGLAPMDQAISTAGGVAWAGVDAELQLSARAGIFVAGEMLDWEAPTGGYLITACMATGRWAGLAAARTLAAPA